MEIRLVLEELVLTDGDRLLLSKLSELNKCTFELDTLAELTEVEESP